MATLSHRAFRELLLDFGGWDYTVTEMTSAEALLNGTPFEWSYTDLAPLPQRVIVQLTAYDAESFAAGAERFLRLRPGGLDLNMGCSAPKVRKRGGGAGWLSRPEEAAEAARAVIDARHRWEECSGEEGPAVSAKLRLPRDGDLRGLLKLMEGLAEAGVEWLTLHGRRVGQPYGRPSSGEAIARVAAEAPLPLCANGDITSPGEAEALLQRHPFGALMPARGVARAPWLPLLISREIREPPGASPGVVPLRGRDIPGSYLETAERFHRYLEEYLPPEFWKTRARRFYAYFSGNFPFGHQLGTGIQHMESYDQLKSEALTRIGRWDAPLPLPERSGNYL
jgi:tRNA-dihydrouridine synthase